MPYNLEKNVVKTLGSCLLLLLLGSCGFHFKGNEESVNTSRLTELAVKGINRYDDIAIDVKKLAVKQGIKITPKAEWSIKISDEEIESWSASTTQSVSTNEYFLRLNAILHIKHGTTVYNDINLTAESLFQDNASLSTSKANEQNIIISELRQQIAADILRRVQYIANNSPDCDCDESDTTTTP